MQFGQILNKTLEFNIPADIFKLNDSLDIQGDLNLTGTVNGVDINQLATDLSSHTGSTANPHQVTLEQTRSQNNQISGNLDFNQNQALKLTLENLGSAPVTPAI